MGYHLSILFFISTPILVFWVSKSQAQTGLFFRPQFFIPRGGSLMKWLPYGVPFESLIFYISPHLRFLGFKFLNEIGLFFRPRFFILTDGWMGWMGWMGWDGWVGKYLFFFCLLHKNYLIYDADCFHAP